ncbi:MAG: hypothetical protein HW413_1219 [Thermoleophilia bacterium]|jgi:hypothetical protein|nr:hypothetical protein [Thermoleophilia bacterium]
MTVVARPAAQTRPGNWSLAALVLAGAGVTAATWLIVATDSDPGAVLWPLVVAPIAIALAPVLIPGSGMRLGSAVAMAAWCVLTGFSIGLLLVPALVAQLTAAIREER